MFALLIFLALVLFVIGTIAYIGYQPVLPSGKKFEYNYKGYKATVIVADDVTCYGKGFIVSGVDKVDGKELAKACAKSMKIVNDNMKAYGPSSPVNPKAKVKRCIFYFMGPKRFKQAQVAVGFSPGDAVKGYAVRAERTFKKFGEGPYMSVAMSSTMKTTVDKGCVAVHELIHIVAHALYNNWDKEHVLWTDRRFFINGKKMEKHCQHIFIDNKELDI